MDRLIEVRSRGSTNFRWILCCTQATCAPRHGPLGPGRIAPNRGPSARRREPKPRCFAGVGWPDRLQAPEGFGTGTGTAAHRLALCIGLHQRTKGRAYRSLEWPYLLVQMLLVHMHCYNRADIKLKWSLLPICNAESNGGHPAQGNLGDAWVEIDVGSMQVQE